MTGKKPDPPNGVRIFVSSTFRDMHAERDELVRFTFPRLRQWCEERGMSFTEIDLRWGVTVAEKDQGLVLPICLEEIDRCRPFFIGLLGGRYGWVEKEFSDEAKQRFPWLMDYSGRSLTELEMIHGALGPDCGPEQTFFYFRDHSDEAEEEDAESRAKLKSLHQRIQQTGRAHPGVYATPQELGDWIFEDIRKALQAFLPDDAASDVTARESAAQNHFAALRSRNWVGTGDLFHLLNKHYRRNGPPLVIVGGAGSGKTALLSCWSRLAAGYEAPGLEILSTAIVRRIRRLLGLKLFKSGMPVPRPDFIIRISVGITRKTSLAEGVAEILELMLLKQIHLALPAPQPGNALAWLASYLEASAKAHRISVIIDGIDRLASAEQEKLLAAIPDHLPDPLRLVLSSAPCSAVDASRKRGWRIRDLPAWNPDARRGFIRSYLSEYRKALEPANEERLASTPQTANPLFLRTVLNELRVAAVHSNLNARIEGYLGSADVSGLYASILSRWESDLAWTGPDLVKRTLRLLWVAKDGLAENELRELLRDGERLPDRSWSPLAITLVPHLNLKDGVLCLERGSLRDAIEKSYLPEFTDKLESHHQLAEYFRTKRMSPRVAGELGWHLIATRHWDQLARVFSKRDFLRVTWKLFPAELLSTAVILERFSTHRISGILSGMSHDLHSAHAAGSILLERGDHEAAYPLFEEAEKKALQAGDFIAAATASAALGLLDRRKGRIPEALLRFESLEKDARVRGDLAAAALYLGYRGEALLSQGRLDEASAAFEEEYRISKDMADDNTGASALGHLAAIDSARDHLNEALSKYTLQSALYLRLGNQTGLAASIGNRATILSRLGRPDAAISLYEIEEKLARSRGNRWALQICLGNQAGHFQSLGDYDRAMRQLDEKEEISRTLGSPDALAKTWMQISQLLYKLNQIGTARSYADQAAALATEHRLASLATSIDEWRSRLAGS